MMSNSAAAAIGSAAAQAPLEVGHRAVDHRTCVVTVVGEIDLASAPALKSALLGLLEEGYRRFALDLSGVRHMDSTGLAVLIGFEQRLSDSGALAVAATPDNVSAVFAITGLDRRFQLLATAEAAVDHLLGVAVKPAQTRLDGDAAMAVGLASTALPFAESVLAEAERWVRILRVHGDAALVLASTEVANAPAGPSRATTAGGRVRDPATAAERIDRVLAHATGAASRRGADAVSTTDLLVGVMAVYPDELDHMLRAHGDDRLALAARLGGRLSAGE